MSDGSSVGNETQFGEGFRIFIGVAELLAVVGLILPGIMRILPLLTAAASLMIVMGSATLLHLSRGESASAIMAVVLFVLITIVAYTR